MSIILYIHCEKVGVMLYHDTGAMDIHGPSQACLSCIDLLMAEGVAQAWQLESQLGKKRLTRRFSTAAHVCGPNSLFLVPHRLKKLEMPFFISQPC